MTVLKKRFLLKKVPLLDFSSCRGNIAGGSFRFVCEVINEFKKGDVISILDEQHNEIARGIVNYGSDSCQKVIGCHSDNIMEILGFKNYDAIITRDNITLL